MPGIPRYRAAVDRNQAAIVEALRRAGCSVVYLKKPVDLGVGRAWAGRVKPTSSKSRCPRPRGSGAGGAPLSRKRFLLNGAGMWRKWRRWTRRLGPWG